MIGRVMTVIHIVGVSGSPRDQGTEAVLELALDHAKGIPQVTTDQINLREFDFRFCTHCNLCLDPSYLARTGRYCQHNDDLETVYPRIIKADSFILATPVYSGNPSGMLWSFLNRLRPVKDAYTQRNKTVQFITVGGSQRAGTDFAMMALMRLAIHGRLIYAPSLSPNHECVGVQIISRNPPGHDAKFASGRYGALNDKTGILATREMVEQLIQYTRLLKAGEKTLGITFAPWKAPHNDPFFRKRTPKSENV